MRLQQKIWQDEHALSKTLPFHDASSPASHVVAFAEFLQGRGVSLKGLKAVDIGCGKGRNAIFLAKQGAQVWAIDYISQAVERTKLLAEREGVGRRVHATEAEIDSTWPFADNFFDVAVDNFSSIDIETRRGREKCRDEMLRTLKPGGLAMVAVVSADDEMEKEMLRESPGSEKNSVIWPATGKFQKDYDKKELLEFYKAFEILEEKKVSRQTTKLGRDYVATNYRLFLRKPVR